MTKSEVLRDKTILVVDDEPDILESLDEVAQGPGGCYGSHCHRIPRSSAAFAFSQLRCSDSRHYGLCVDSIFWQSLLTKVFLPSCLPRTHSTPRLSRDPLSWVRRLICPRPVWQIWFRFLRPCSQRRPNQSGERLSIWCSGSSTRAWDLNGGSLRRNS